MKKKILEIINTLPSNPDSSQFDEEPYRLAREAVAEELLTLFKTEMKKKLPTHKGKMITREEVKDIIDKIE